MKKQFKNAKVMDGGIWLPLDEILDFAKTCVKKSKKAEKKKDADEIAKLGNIWCDLAERVLKEEYPQGFDFETAGYVI